MEVAARVQPNVTPTPGVQTQTSSGSPSDKQKKPFDPEQLKDEKAALGVARELAEAQADAAIHSAQSTSNSAATERANLAAPRDSAEWSRTEGAPNWSTLSAAAKGYTTSERAINLYRHINAMAM